jgi:hypothetical protein
MRCIVECPSFGLVVVVVVAGGVCDVDDLNGFCCHCNDDWARHFTHVPL